MTLEGVLQERVPRRIPSPPRQDLVVLRVAVGLGVAGVISAVRASAPGVQLLDVWLCWWLGHGEDVDVPEVVVLHGGVLTYFEDEGPLGQSLGTTYAKL